jgi:hypothetical protein
LEFCRKIGGKATPASEAGACSPEYRLDQDQATGTSRRYADFR